MRAGTPPLSRLGSQEDERAAATDWRGITLVHRGSELGVVGRVSREGAGSEPVLHAFGGISRSLEYAVPESAIVAVFGVSARALVNDIVEFEPQHLCGDGRVILVPRTPRGDTEPEREGWRRRPQAAWVGIRVYADDGYLGEVEANGASGRAPAGRSLDRAGAHAVLEDSLSGHPREPRCRVHPERARGARRRDPTGAVEHEPASTRRSLRERRPCP